MRSSLSSRVAFAALLVLALPAAAWAQGTGTGLFSEYYSEKDFGGTRAARVEGPINFIYVGTGANADIPAAVMPETDFSVRMRGRIELTVGGDWIFNLRTDDGGRLYIDGVLRGDFWRDQGMADRRVTITGMTAGKHDIMIEVYQGGGDAGCQLLWDEPGAATEVIVPVDRLYAVVDTVPAIPVSAIATPLISPAGAAPPQTVTLSTTTPTAVIYYTTDNTDPGPSVPVGTAVLYTVPFAVNDYAKVTARAYLLGSDTVASDPASTTYSPNFAGVVAPGAVSGNAYFRYYHPGTGLSVLPNFDVLASRQRGVATVVDTNPPKEQTNDFGFVYTGYVNVVTPGTYTFFLNSCTGSKLFVQNKLVVNNDGLRSFNQERSGTITLQAGLHPFRVDYWRRDQGTTTLQFQWQNLPTIAKAVVPPANLYTDPVAATPTTSPNGGNILGPTPVTLSCSTPGAILYWNLDGTPVNPANCAGSGPSGSVINLSTTTVLRVMATAPGVLASPTASITFTRTSPLAFSASAAATPTEVLVTFDKPLNAVAPSNFTINNGVTVSAAQLLPRSTDFLRAHWKFDETVTNTPVADASGNGNTGTPSPGPSPNVPTPDALEVAPIQTGNPASLSFDGTDDYVSIPDSASLTFGNSGFTVALWVYPLDTTNRRVLNKFDPTTGADKGWIMDLHTNATGNLRFRVDDGANTQDAIFGTGTVNAIVANQWQHIVGRLDRLANRLSVFRNGVFLGSADLPTTYTSCDTTRPLLLARLESPLGPPPTVSGNLFRGRMDDLRIYNTALSNAEIAALHANSQTTFLSTVRLTTSALAASTVYSMNVQGVADHLGNAIAAPGVDVPFQYYAAGTIARDTYGNPTIGGASVAELARNAAFPNAPSGGTTYASFETPNNAADNFGARLRGFFIPTFTGDHFFAIATDDHGQLWLSTDDNPANKRLIAWQTGSAGPRIWNNFASQRSAAIPLTLNQKYYIEAYYKNDTGNDNCAVAVKNVGTFTNTTDLAIAGTQLAPYLDSVLFITQPTSKSVNVGQAVTFSVVTSGAAPKNFQWQKWNGAAFANIAGATSSSYTIAAAALGDAGDYRVRVQNVVDTATSDTVRLDVYDPGAAPTIGSLNLTQGSTLGGQTVTITGTNFIPSYTTVTFGGAAATITNIPDSATIICTTPAHAAGAVTVAVSTPAGSGASASAFTYYAAPTVSNVSPANSQLGGRTGIVVTGTGFTNGVTGVLIDGVSALNINVTSATSITCDAPPRATPGAVNLTVTNPGSSATLTNGFTYWNPPTVGVISPANAQLGGRTGITINGTNFASGDVTVTIGGVTALNISVSSPTQIACDAPASASAGAVNVVVTSAGSTPVTVTNGFTYWNPPTLTVAAPANGPLGGRTGIVLTGTNFASNDVTVSFGGTGALNIVVDSASQITCDAPAHAAGAVNIVLSSAGSAPVTLTGGFTYWAAPTVTTIMAPWGSADGRIDGTTVVTITGTNFSNSADTQVLFGGVPSPTVVVSSSTQILANAPARAASGAPLPVNVQVNSSGGAAPVVTNGFTYHDPPTAASAAPTSGSTSGGTGVTVLGTNLPATKTLVTVGGSAASAIVATGAQVTFNTPAHASGTVAIVVTTPGGTASPPQSFDYAGPFVSGIAPNSGPAAGGQPGVVISGNDLSGATSVEFGLGNNAAITGNTANQITVSTPPGTGTVSVIVTTPSGSFTLSNAYTYTTAPTISGITPAQGPTAGGQAVQITGTSFVDGFTTVTFNGVNATIVTVTGTTVDVTTPPGTAGTASVVVTTFGSQPSAGSNLYSYVAPPSVATISSNRGPAAGGQPVSITGANFVPGATAVLFGAATATINTITTTTMTVTTPPGAIGATNVIVRTFGTVNSQSTPLTYTYVDGTTAVDLSLTKIVDNGSATVGQNVTFTITLSNAAGAAAGTAVTVSDPLPAALTFVSSTATVGSYSAASGIWTVGNIAANSSATLNITATVNSAVSILNVAEVLNAAEEDVDSVENNFSTTEDDRATASVDSGLSVQTPAALPAATARAFYSVTLAASGGAPPYTWGLVTSSPPFPFNLDPATGVMSGFAPDVAGVTPYTFTLSVTDSAQTPQSVNRAFTLTVNMPTAGPPVVSNSPAAPNAVVGQAYRHVFTAAGGATPYTWTSTGTVPTGLALNRFTGVLEGVPAAAGAASFSVIATPATGAASAPLAVAFTIATSPITIVQTTLPGGMVGALYTHYLDVTGGVGPTFTWSNTGTLPPNTTLTFVGRRARISGTPLTATTANFTIQVTDGGQAAVNTSRAFSVIIVAAAPAPGAAIVVTTPSNSLPIGTVGQVYPAAGTTAALSATGGTGTYFWTAPNGGQPPGLAINGGSGAITGTPTAAGIFTFTVQAAPFGPGPTPGTKDITITIAPAPTLTTPLALPAGVQGAGYFADLTFAGGASPVTWTLTGTLPTGIVLNGAAGTLSGVPTNNGSFSFRLTATDANGAAVFGDFTLIIADPAALVAIASLPRGQVGIPYSATLQAAGGTPPYTLWTQLGGMPAGLSLDVDTGTISGTPAAAGTTSVNFQVTDTAAGTDATLAFNLIIDGTLTITTLSLPIAGVTSPYGASLTATGGTGTLVWELVSGSLPGGVSLSPAGIFSGTVSATAVTSSFQVRVTDGLGRTANRSYSITVGPAIPVGGGGSSGGGGGCGGSIGLGTLPLGALAALGALLALSTRRRRRD
ncbi:MAG TPA: IPT/TIG domain-containing protein [Planctomycetota bacterium]